MTDLISTLADSIIALINASPRSPRKDEIMALLRGPYEEATRTLADAQLLASYPMLHVTYGRAAGPVEAGDILSGCGGGSYIKWSGTNDPASWTPVTQEQLVAAADQICAEDMDRCNNGKHYSSSPYGPCFCGLYAVTAP